MQISSEEELIQKTIHFVKNELRQAEGGHDWFHIERVFKNAMLISTHEPVNKTVVKLGALLHDIADYKFTGGNETRAPKMAREFLSSENVPQEISAHVVKIIENVSFKGGNQTQEFRSRELDVVQDADRLDAMGAIGIARTFNYGGFKNRKLYDPEIKPNLEMSPEEYKVSNGPTINHFYEKLLLLKDGMKTHTGKEIAANRHQFMQKFLDQFYAEWNGQK